MNSTNTKLEFTLTYPGSFFVFLRNLLVQIHSIFLHSAKFISANWQLFAVCSELVSTYLIQIRTN